MMSRSARVMCTDMEKMMRGCRCVKAGGLGHEGSGLRNSVRVWGFVHVTGWVRWSRRDWCYRH